MRYITRHMVITLYISLLGFCVVTVCIFSVQSERAKSKHRCNGDLSGSCKFEHERQSFEGAFPQKTNPLFNSTKFNSVASVHKRGEQKRETYSAKRYTFHENDTVVRPGEHRVKTSATQKGTPNTGHNVVTKSRQLSIKPSRSRQKIQNSFTNPQGASRMFPTVYKPVLPNGLNCSRVWLGDQKEISRGQRELKDTTEARRPPGFYANVTRNCSAYARETGYIWNASREEESFPLAFSILLYKDVEQVERLLRAVYRPHNVYCLHVDLKASPQVMADVRSLITCLPNVIEAPRRISVKWGKFSVLEPELICMKALWRMRTKWRYFINLTGQEFPLKTNKELVRILQEYRGTNDIMGEVPKERYLWRFSKAGPPPHVMAVAKGPVHVAASRGFVDFVLHSPSAHDLLAWTRKTSFPDETFFATLNNQYKLGVPGSYMGNMTSRRRIALNRWKVWDKSRHPCGGHFVRHICHFGLPDVQRLVHSRHMVANKFSYDYQPLGYDCIEQWYFDKVRTEHATGTISGVDTRYYRDLEIVKFALRENGTVR
ncbi:hypothetical protein BaRGS_00019364 [Batillaria attramentaria]|uniref:Beta-1,3-galactosyl-O-glycosyl-glycoprotein beta-1,6-N-acetylglucosaminyltransferase n=1 Tax=Batillaria attramentaria TaxID=370345 RepID=A0ABD0KQ88_9CAEN